MKAIRLIAGAVLVIASSTQVFAEPMHPYLDRKHTVLVGGFRQSVDAEVYADAENRGAGVDLGDLGMDEVDNSWMLEYRYRLGENWQVSAGAFTFSNSGTIAAERDFSYDGVDFKAGVTIESELQIDTYMVDVLYKVYDSDRAEVLIGGGLHIFDLDTEIETLVSVDGGSRAGQRGESELLAPLPNLRMQGFYALTPKWALSATLGWLSMTYEDYDGSFTYLHARTSYQLTDRFGVSLGYQYIDIDLTRDRERGETGLDASFNGPSVVLSYGF
jgi:hypothetical protein